MATKHKTEETTVEVKAEEMPSAESIYTAGELAENYKLFHTSREIVIVALRLAGKDTATLQEAKNIIEKFKNKEVC